MNLDVPSPGPERDFSAQPMIPSVPPIPLPAEVQVPQVATPETQAEAQPPPQPPRKMGWLAGLVAAVAVAGAIGWWMSSGTAPPHGGDRNLDANVQKVNERSHPGDEWLGHVDRTGQLTFVKEIVIGNEDRDPVTAAAVANALKSNDPQALQAALLAAQQIPAMNDPLDHGPNPKPLPRQEPKVTPELQSKVLNQECEFVKFYIFDCADEDGDVAEVLVNGVSFTVVPLTRKGALISVPVPKNGGAELSIRGVRDGEGGGVTVGIRTTKGDHLVRALREGEVISLGRLKF